MILQRLTKRFEGFSFKKAWNNKFFKEVFYDFISYPVLSEGKKCVIKSIENILKNKYYNYDVKLSRQEREELVWDILDELEIVELDITNDNHLFIILNANYEELENIIGRKIVN